MAGKIVVKSQELNEAAVQISNKNQELTGTLTQIKNTIVNLCSSTWTGEASAKAKEKMDAFYNKTFSSYTNAVDEYVAFIKQTATAYEQAETQNTSNANMQMDDSAVADFT